MQATDKIYIRGLLGPLQNTKELVMGITNVLVNNNSDEYVFTGSNTIEISDRSFWQKHQNSDSIEVYKMDSYGDYTHFEAVLTDIISINYTEYAIRIVIGQYSLDMSEEEILTKALDSVNGWECERIEILETKDAYIDYRDAVYSLIAELEIEMTPLLDEILRAAPVRENNSGIDCKFIFDLIKKDYDLV